MGLPLELWRARIGCLSPGIRKSPGKMAAITLGHGCALFVRLAVLFGLIFVGLPHSQHPEPLRTDMWKVLRALIEPSPIEQPAGPNYTYIAPHTIRSTTACTVHTAVCYF